VGRATQLAQACGDEAGAWRQAWAGLRDGIPPELALPLPAWLAAAAQTPLGVFQNPNKQKHTQCRSDLWLGVLPCERQMRGLIDTLQRYISAMLSGA